MNSGKCNALAGPGHPNLLFVAHRREILQQSLATFRQVLFLRPTESAIVFLQQL